MAQRWTIRAGHDDAAVTIRKNGHPFSRVPLAPSLAETVARALETIRPHATPGALVTVHVAGVLA